MAQPQKGICAEPNLHGVFLMFNVADGYEPEMRSKLAQLLALFEHYEQEHYEAMVSGVIAIGSNYWMELYPGLLPAELAPFPDFSELDRSAPVVPADLFIQLRADRADVCHALGQDVCRLLAGDVELVEQIKGFRYLDGRDLTGFVDDCNNPRGPRKYQVAIVGDEDPAFRGGSYVHVQRYQYQMDKWQRLSLADQQQIMGRDKDNNQVTIPTAPFSHHIKMQVVDQDGTVLEMLRHSMPYGDMLVQGQYFISCARSSEPFTQLLRNRIVADQDGYYDRLLDFMSAETGGAFFAPSIDFIQQQAD